MSTCSGINRDSRIDENLTIAENALPGSFPEGKMKPVEEEVGMLERITLPVNLYKKVFRFIKKTPDPFSSQRWERNYVVEDDCLGFNVTKCLYVAYLL
jgi:hypothetical protein